jgi:trans-aconitate 2-methyltransferase
MTIPSKSIHWNAKLYDNKHAFVWEHGASIVQWLSPNSGERILDLGCGTGQLTASIAETGAEVVGIDSSATMLAEARQNYPEIEFVHADAHEFHFDKPFDAVFSNAVLHWISDPYRVVANWRPNRLCYSTARQNWKAMTA